MNDAPTPIETFRPQVPKKLRAIMYRGLMRKPEDRFATPGELAEALAKHATGHDLKALYRKAETLGLLEAAGLPRRALPRQ